MILICDYLLWLSQKKLNVVEKTYYTKQNTYVNDYPFKYYIILNKERSI